MTKRRKVTRKQLGDLGIRKDQVSVVEAVVDVERREATAQVETRHKLQQAKDYIGKRAEEEREKREQMDRKLREHESFLVARDGPPVIAGPYNEFGELRGGVVEELRIRKASKVEFIPEPGPTITRSRSGRVIIQRGCLLCGVDLILPGARSIPQRLPASGHFCGDCDRALDHWSRQVENRIRMGQELAKVGATELPSTDYVGLCVTHRLQDERPDLVAEGVDCLPDWLTKTWAHRVMASPDPESQEPYHEPFGYLMPVPSEQAGQETEKGNEQ